jgi:hypothetical protein
MREGLFMPHSHVQPGDCCHCLRPCLEVGAIVNLIFLKQRAPVAGTGWGCKTCGIPEDGAMAVLCEECHKESKPILYACIGLVIENNRVPIESLSKEPFEHNVHAHPEYFRPDDDVFDFQTLRRIGVLVDGAKRRGLDKNWRWN